MKLSTIFFLFLTSLCYSQNINVTVAGDEPLKTKFVELRISTIENANQSSGGITEFSSEEVSSYLQKKKLKFEIELKEKSKYTQKTFIINEVSQQAFEEINNHFHKEDPNTLFKSSFKHSNYEIQNKAEAEIKLYKSLIKKSEEKAMLVCKALNGKEVELLKVKVLETFTKSVRSGFDGQTLFTKLEVEFKVAK